MLRLWSVATSIALAPLTVPGSHPAAFRDASLETRCDALRAYVRDFATAHMTDTTYTETGCAEGNGLGGARYSLDFRLGKEKASASYRLDLAYEGKGAVKVLLCDANGNPSACSVNLPAEPLKFETRGERLATPAAAQAAARAFEAKSAKAAQLLPTVARWAAAAPAKHQIFGQDYLAFVAQQIKYTGGYPVQDEKGPVLTKFVMTPASAKAPQTGKVTFTDPVTPGLLACFKCSDAACLNGSVTYRFDDRFLALTRQIPAAGDAKSKGQQTEVLGAGWIISTPAPVTGDGWKYICGASRYSLQNVNL